MGKHKTAIALAIRKIKKVQSLVSNSSQQMGLAQAMDILEDYKKKEKQQIKRSYNQGHTWASEVGSEDFFNQDYTQSSE